MQSQSALTLFVALAHTDLLAMVPRQWMELLPMAGMLQQIKVREVLPAPPIVFFRRTGLPLTPSATFLVDMLYCAARGRSERRKAQHRTGR
jgi:LysR family transcriptional regulator of abg operon